jgi:adenine phosphoribosyltransferase
MGGMSSSSLSIENDESALREAIATHPDFPVPGIAFKDIVPLIADGEKFAAAIDRLHDRLTDADLEFDAIMAVESRGFIFGAPLASRLRRGLVLVRKPGKLPGQTDTFGYTCEYATGTLTVQSGAVRAGQRYLVLDDLLATGGTARAVADYASRQGGIVAGYCFFIELSFLEGRRLLADAPLVSLLVY